MPELITELQSYGVRVPDAVTGRKCGAGPAEGRALLVGDIAVNVPIGGHYVARSPYHIEPHGNDYLLFKNGHALTPLTVVPDPHFYRFFSTDGNNFRKIALLHGNDCLATTVIQPCVHWKTGRQCAFCGTQFTLDNGSTLARKHPQQLAEVAKMASQLDKVTHAVLTSGTADPPSAEIPYLARCAAAIKKASGLPVHVQFAPPKDLGLMELLKSAGVDTVGIHVESFDPPTLARLAPAKAAIGMLAFEKSWRHAVALFGPNQVSSFLIAGLGEPPESIVRGSELLADLGVYPFVVPLRPIPGSAMQNATPPEAGLMDRIYRSVARILADKGLSAAKSLAGCVRCGACTALHAYERPIRDRICHPARTESEVADALAIRRDVFVTEQGLFSGTDLDGHDETATLLVAKLKGKTIGTVRIYPDETHADHWIGGRLAVKKGYRDFRVAAMLVKAAMKQVQRRGCTCFTAQIQEKNVPFFKKIGWYPVGPPSLHHGKPHQRMQADLNSVSDRFIED